MTTYFQGQADYYYGQAEPCWRPIPLPLNPPSPLRPPALLEDDEEPVEKRPLGQTEAGPSYPLPETVKGSSQPPLDPVDEMSMESFPCSDPPCTSRSHA